MAKRRLNANHFTLFQVSDTPRYVTKCKFMWSTHSEAKQMETLEFGVEKGIFQGHAR